ncbi:nitroreductase family deazaflavin-dependent oxidoreductase [Allosaccharopolyspora coralli]|uniref:Nitroreductase family deazaflavin-dependent oxidoreductase n=1 Tax=Allosaccharopolyspora coralli TaxID=2665642 RepID=A0A5Q3Q5R4_9PSEU|nr:nitroreductase family deazaflavin-dependent oxidoreductase [Allosaccharopolyspora coralli]
MPVDFNTSVIDEFRANNGHVGGPFENARLLLLTTVGARTGRAHTTPVGYLPDGNRMLVIASAAGGPTHPDWFHNLVAQPRVTVEDGTFRYEATATVLAGVDRLIDELDMHLAYEEQHLIPAFERRCVDFELSRSSNVGSEHRQRPRTPTTNWGRPP